MQKTSGGGCDLYGDAESPKLILIHGVGLSRAMWDAQVECLARDFHVLTYDLLGHGESENPPGARVLFDFTEQLRQLAAHCGFARFALAGFSMGALIALAFAAAYPARVTHLALLHAVFRRNPAQRDAVQARLRRVEEQGGAAAADAALQRWFSREYRDAHAARMHAIRESLGAPGDGYVKAYRVFANADDEIAPCNLARITCPALALTGGGDANSSAHMSRALCGELPHAQLIINPRHRHLSPLEHAPLICKQLREFLQT